MDEVKLDRLVPGLPVCDVRGDKIGTLAHVHRAETTADVPSSEVSSTTSVMTDKFVEVKTGIFGLGKHYYVPSRAIETVTDDHVILDRPREALNETDWATRPDNLRKVN